MNPEELLFYFAAEMVVSVTPMSDGEYRIRMSNGEGWGVDSETARSVIAQCEARAARSAWVEDTLETFIDSLRSIAESLAANVEDQR
jgi:hypothetical protein